MGPQVAEKVVVRVADASLCQVCEQPVDLPNSLGLCEGCLTDLTFEIAAVNNDPRLQWKDDRVVVRPVA